MFQQEIKVPKQRIAVVIGKEGETKKQLQTRTKTELEIDSDEGIIKIKGDDSVHLFKVEKIIQAIGRGFNPEIALSLLNENNCLEIVQIKDFSGKSKKKEKRIKSRIIGAKGKTRNTLEFLTSTHISIYGKTISIIGEIEPVAIARQAIQDILSGAPHGPVYGVIEKRMKDLKRLK